MVKTQSPVGELSEAGLVMALLKAALQFPKTYNCFKSISRACHSSKGAAIGLGHCPSKETPPRRKSRVTLEIHSFRFSVATVVKQCRPTFLTMQRAIWRETRRRSMILFHTWVGRDPSRIGNRNPSVNIGIEHGIFHRADIRYLELARVILAVLIR